MTYNTYNHEIIMTIVTKLKRNHFVKMSFRFFMLETITYALHKKKNSAYSHTAIFVNQLLFKQFFKNQIMSQNFLYLLLGLCPAEFGPITRNQGITIQAWCKLSILPGEALVWRLIST